MLLPRFKTWPAAVAIVLVATMMIRSTTALTVATTTATTTSCKPHILCVGLAAVDFVAVTDHFPVPDEKMRSATLLVEGGGNAANTACAMGRLSTAVSVSLATAVGNDANGPTILAGLHEYNVDTEYCQQFVGSSPFSYILTTDVDGDSTRTCIHQPATGELTVDFVETAINVQQFDAVHFDGRYPAAAVALAQRCVQLGIPYSVDVERPREGLTELLQGATVVICNSDYCNTILKDDDDDAAPNDDDPAARLRKVMQQQAPQAAIAVQTLGSKGSCLIRLQQQQQQQLDSTAEEWKDGILLKEETDDSNVPTVTVQDGALFCEAFGGCTVVDTTGAGDAFQGGFLTALWAAAAAADSDDSVGSSVFDNPAVLGHALRIGSRVAGQKVQQPGARRGLPSSVTDTFIQAEMKAMLDKLQQQVLYADAN